MYTIQAIQSDLIMKKCVVVSGVIISTGSKISVNFEQALYDLFKIMKEDFAMAATGKLENPYNKVLVD